MLLQKETNKLFEKDIRFVVTRDSVGGMGNWVKVTMSFHVKVFVWTRAFIFHG